MSVTETLNEGLKRGYKIVVPASDLDAKVNEKLAEAQPEVEMKGFRKGKVPMALLKKNFGQRLMGEAMQEAVDGAMNAHFEETGHRPAMQPEVKMTNEDWKEGDDVEVEMTYEALPDIPDVDLSDIKLERLVVKASDDEVNDALKNLAENAQNFEDRKKGSKAKDGDQVVIDFVGKVDGEAFEGGAAEDYPLSAVLVVPNDTRSGTILRGRYLDPENPVQIAVPAEIVAGLVDRIFRIATLLDAVTLIIGVAAAAAMGLALYLSWTLRAPEMATARRLGAGRFVILRLAAAEIAILLSAVIAIAACLVVAVIANGDGIVAWLLAV